ncbi:YraN family protein [Zobellella denitrificans]|uniref:YraN family protein n=1 Tax=Zobellella denitrificans TaxID=347534 RepID=UPI000B8BF50F|nr:YraN family protein [Zobellella denitrificans]OXS15802.1 YraN family protein [Zobellella denitrificans]
MAPGYPTGTSRARGEQFERRAEQFLLGQGLCLVARNYQCKLGEIDLVMRTGTTLVFVEVRYRRSNHYGGALASVTATKQQRLRRAALSYLQSQGLNESRQSCRFDLIACDGSHIDWIPNAF